MPNGLLRQYKYGTDTLRFNPANVAAGNNTASVAVSYTHLDVYKRQIMILALLMPPFTLILNFIFKLETL